MQENLNTPPFAIGQKVVALTSSSDKKIVKDKVYTIADIHFFDCCPKSSAWYAILSENKSNTLYSCWNCNAINEKVGKWYKCKYFAPIQTQYTDITKEIADSVKETVEAPDKILIPQTVNN